MGMGIVVIGSSFMDIKGFPHDIYLPTGRNMGRVEYIHGGVARNLVEDIANIELRPTYISLVDDTPLGEAVYKKLRAEGIRAKLDDRSESMNYKIRESLQDKKVPYVCVIGDKEIESNAVAVRKRGVGQVGTINVDEFIQNILEEIKNKN